jgi:acetolactate synthase-1/2/3 large subunit
VILVLDHDVPYIPTLVQPPADATVVQIDLDPIKERIPLWSFPVSLPIRADTGRALAAIAGAAGELLTGAARARIESRRTAMTAAHDQRRAAWDVEARTASKRRPIAREWLSYCLGQLERESGGCVFVDETVTSSYTLWRHLSCDEPGSIYGSGGSGLGWALGAAVGIKLAQPGRTVVALVGDGSFVFGEPLAALWTARVQAAPILVVVFNNGCYNATREPLLHAYPGGYSARGRRVGIDLLPSPRYDLLAPAVDAAGERVEDPDAVLPALHRGLQEVRRGRSVVLNVILALPDVPV